VRASEVRVQTTQLDDRPGQRRRGGGNLDQGGDPDRVGRHSGVDVPGRLDARPGQDGNGTPMRLHRDRTPSDSAMGSASWAVQASQSGASGAIAASS
jgi:hypothetical protein